MQTQLSLVDLGDEQCHDGYATWYWNDAALMESCRNGTFGYGNAEVKKCSIFANSGSMLSTTTRVIIAHPLLLEQVPT